MTTTKAASRGALVLAVWLLACAPALACTIDSPSQDDNYDTQATIATNGSCQQGGALTVELLKRNTSGGFDLVDWDVVLFESGLWRCDFDPPMGGWAQGDYMVLIRMDGEPGDSVLFTVVESGGS
ncbi:MAG: hypothetical protein WBC44_04800 [Planctomycetaceae bacterium]